jgi:hypothetical protein
MGKERESEAKREREFVRNELPEGGSRASHPVTPGCPHHHASVSKLSGQEGGGGGG